MTAAVVLALAVLVVRRPSRVPTFASAPVDMGVLQLARLVSLGLSAGLAPLGAMRQANDYVDEPVYSDVASVVRHAVAVSTSAAFLRADGPSSELCRVMARSIETGAAAGPAVAGLVDRLEADLNAKQVAALKRLPVKLMVPLALLMLPGLMLIVLSPAVVDVLTRLS